MNTNRHPRTGWRIAALVAGLAALTLAGCANYGSRWKEAAQAPPDGWKDLTGAWEGRWVSPGSGHEGPLWCLVSEDDSDESVIHCWYRARWGALAGNFRNEAVITPLSPGSDGPRYAIAGNSRLFLYGRFTLEAEGTPSAIDGTYRSFGDTGTIQLRRPGSGDPDSPGDPR